MSITLQHKAAPQKKEIRQEQPLAKKTDFKQMQTVISNIKSEPISLHARKSRQLNESPFLPTDKISTKKLKSTSN